jgi:putative addiction module component (TIGR02574 family)
MTTMQGGNRLMVYSAKEFDFSKMSVPERIQLVQDLWDSVHDEVQAIGLTDEQRQEMRRRLKELESAEVQGVHWEELQKSLRAE